MVENCIVYVYTWSIRFYLRITKHIMEILVVFKGNISLFVFEYIYNEIYYLDRTIVIPFCIVCPLFEYFHGFANFLSFSIIHVH